MSQKIKKTRRILSPQEVSRFAELKTICHNGLKTFWEVGTALIEIHETKLYLQAFDSFQAFCKEEFNVGRQYAYRLMQATKMKLLSPMGDTLDSERQSRALSAVPEAERAGVLDRASSNGRPTALRITE